MVESDHSNVTGSSLLNKVFGALDNEMENATERKNLRGLQYYLSCSAKCKELMTFIII